MESQATVVDGLLDRHAALTSFLREKGELSLAVEAELTFKKLFVMACGSFFEERITHSLSAFAGLIDARLGSFVRRKALERQFHTLFEWDSRNINKFLGLFGDDFKSDVGSAIRADKKLEQGMAAFIEIFGLRNRVAHSNLAAVSVEKTVEELELLYRSAWNFVRILMLRFGVDCSGSEGSA